MVGCAGNLCIWAARTGDLLHKFTVVHGKEKLNHPNSRFDMTLLTMNCVFFFFLVISGSVCCLCYSPDGAQLAAGLSTGEVQVFEIACSSSIFLLPPPKVTEQQQCLTLTSLLIMSYGINFSTLSAQSCNKLGFSDMLFID